MNRLNETPGHDSASAGSLTRCDHVPCCPAASATDCRKAHVRTSHAEQGWCLLCNGVIFFDDGGAILPDGHVLEPLNSESSRAA
jgi:hypothetical protein